jgi:hypothetical protein
MGKDGMGNQLCPCHFTKSITVEKLQSTVTI